MKYEVRDAVVRLIRVYDGPCGMLEVGTVLAGTIYRPISPYSSQLMVGATSGKFAHTGCSSDHGHLIQETVYGPSGGAYRVWKEVSPLEALAECAEPDDAI